ncbi:MAG: autotransporter outer membrane beta-barrel domain-containing protein [Rhodobiaceae bacterium]|nr:autotransporter outer membrane beta-barrel domain-containing protein [Rhodobiaceae bacterium]
MQFAPDIRLPSGLTFTFLSANAISGAFDNAASTSLFYVSTLTQTGTEVRVTLAKTGSVGDIAPEGGQRNVARVLESLPQGVSEGLRNAIAALGSAQTAGEARSILRQLSGENHGLDPSLGQGGIAGVNTLLATRLARIGRATAGPGVTLAALTQEQTETLNGARGVQPHLGRHLHRGNRLATLFTTLAPVMGAPMTGSPVEAVPDEEVQADALSVGSSRADLGTGIWLETFRTYGDVEASAQASGVGYRILGTTVGFDSKVSERLVLGGAVSYTKTDTDIVTGLGDGAETRGTHATAYGRYSFDGFDLLSAFSLTKNETEAMRITRIGGVTQRAASAYEGWSMSANAGVTTNVSFHGVDIAPAVSLAYVHQSTDGFSETGSGALLTVSSRRNDALNLRGVVRFSRRIDLTTQVAVTPEVRVGGIYDLLNEDASVVARFSGTAATFRTQGAQTDRGGALLGGGAVFHLQDGLHLYADYDGYYAGNETSHTGLVGARLSF